MALSKRRIENAVLTLLRRCIQCEQSSPTCPACPAGYLCTTTLSDCQNCAVASCQKAETISTASTSTHHGPNVGAIAGGVVGGVVFVAIGIFLFWRLFVKNRRQEYQVTVEITEEKTAGGGFTMRQDARSSRHTVASMASTVLTRASNIIQIAYIPGVTNRSGPQSPGVLVPPVPPIPSAMAPSTPGASSPFTDDGLLFVPGDLRDSTYSGLSDGRTSYARTSITPSLARSSVATTIYRDNAVVQPLPASQTILRGKAAVVSVKSSNNNSPVETPAMETPPVPQIPFSKFNKPIKVAVPQSSDTRRIGPSPSGSIHSAITVGKPTALTITRKVSKASATSASSSENNGASAKVSQTTLESSRSEAVSTMRPLTEYSVADSVDTGTTHARAHRQSAHSRDLLDDAVSDCSDDDTHERSRRSLLRHSPPLSNRDSTVTDIADTPVVQQAGFAGASSVNILDTVSEEGSRRGRDDQLSAKDRDVSPFGDEHEVK